MPGGDHGANRVLPRSFASSRSSRVVFQFQIGLLTCSVALCLARPAHGQRSRPWTIDFFLREKARVEAQIAETNDKLSHAQQVQQQAQAALNKAESLNDPTAEGVARQATALANAAIQTDQRSLEKEQAYLAAINRALSWNQLHVAYGAELEHRGPVFVRSKNAWVPFDGNSPLLPGQQIKTGPQGFLDLEFSDGTKTQLDSNTDLIIEKIDKLKSIFKVIQGRIHASVNCLKAELGSSESPCAQPEFEDANGDQNAVRGTSFVGDFRPDGSETITVLEGHVDVSSHNRGETLHLGAGEQITVGRNGTMGRLATVDLKSIPQWWEK